MKLSFAKILIVWIGSLAVAMAIKFYPTVHATEPASRMIASIDETGAASSITTSGENAAQVRAPKTVVPPAVCESSNSYSCEWRLSAGDENDSARSLRPCFPELVDRDFCVAVLKIPIKAAVGQRPVSEVRCVLQGASFTQMQPPEIIATDLEPALRLLHERCRELATQNRD